MGVYINGMEMPKSCFYCPFRKKVNPDDYVCMAINREFEETFESISRRRHKDCPLVLVPPHGRLIDADALETDTEYDQYLDDFTSYSHEQIRMAPTIITADEGE